MNFLLIFMCIALATVPSIEKIQYLIYIYSPKDIEYKNIQKMDIEEGFCEILF